MADWLLYVLLWYWDWIWQTRTSHRLTNYWPPMVWSYNFTSRCCCWGSQRFLSFSIIKLKEIHLAFHITNNNSNREIIFSGTLLLTQEKTAAILWHIERGVKTSTLINYDDIIKIWHWFVVSTLLLSCIVEEVCQICMKYKHKAYQSFNHKLTTMWANNKCELWWWRNSAMSYMALNIQRK